MKLFDAQTAGPANAALLSALPPLIDEVQWLLTDAEGLAAFYSKTRDPAKHERFFTPRQLSCRFQERPCGRLKEHHTMTSMIYEKTSTGATPLFGGRQPAGTVSQDTGRTNADSRNGSAGGYVRPGTISERAGSLLRPSLAGGSPVR